MSKRPSPHELLHAALATQLGMLSLDDAQSALADFADNGDASLRKTIVAAQRLSAAQDELVAKLVEAYLAAQPEEARRNIDVLEKTPQLKNAIDVWATAEHDMTVSFDGSRTSGRRAGDPQDIRLRVTPTGERFRPLKLHASGGLGEVFLARDEQLKRDVALKQLQDKHADDPLKRERFVLEGEVTGALEHPGIVPVYALGVDAKGHAFYAMRFVRGESLRNAVLRWQKDAPANLRYRRDAIELRRLLTRFMGVCQAMEYAHSRGVIHRDLKPANIMLGKHGETYVVDWGLARIAGGGLGDPAQDGEEKLRPEQLSDFSGTSYGSIVGTPAYMSPEQASGDSYAVGVPSDIYSLGATLFHLLAGRPPFLVEDMSPRDFIKKVERGEFPHPRTIEPQIPRELEAICLRSMALVPAERYATAEAFAADIERWLADEPVDASPPRLVEQAARWGRKHRTAAVVGGVALTTIAIGASVAAVALDRARERQATLALQNKTLAQNESLARGEAERRFLEARETVDEWMTGYSAALTHYPGVQRFRQAMLERAAEEYEEFVAQRADDPALQAERGRTFVRLGDLRRSLAEPDAAIAAYRQALDVFDKLPPPAGALPDPAIAWADAQGRLALAHGDVRDSEAVVAAFAAAAARLTPIADDAKNPWSKDAAAALATIDVNRGIYLHSLGQYDAAQSALDAAADRLRRLLALEPNNLTNRTNLAAAELGLGRALLDRGDAAAAAERFAAAAQFYAAAASLDPGDPTRLEHKAAAQLYLAAAHRLRGDDRAEARAYAEAMTDYQRLVEAQPDALVYIENQALVQTDLAQLLRELGDATEAARLLTASKLVLNGLVSTPSAIARYHEELAIAADGLAELYVATDQATRALPESELAVRKFRELTDVIQDTPAYRERLAIALVHQGQALSRLNDSTADERFREATEVLARLLADDPGVASHRHAAALAHVRRGDALTRHGDADDATAAYAAGAEHWRKLVEESQDPLYHDGAAWFFATCPVTAQRDLAIAQRAAEQAVAQAPANERMRATLALVHLRAGRSGEALGVLRLSDDRLAEAHGKSLLVSVLALDAAGRDEDARKHFALAEAWLAEHLPGDWELTRLRDECRAALDDAGAASEDVAGEETATDAAVGN